MAYFEEEFTNQQEAADDFVESFDEVDEVEEVDLDSRFSEAQKRLVLAMYYNEAMKSGLFTDGSEAGNLVNQEVGDFIRGRLEELMGMVPAKQVKQVVVESQFTEEEAGILKLLLRKFAEKASPQVPSIPPKPVVEPKAPPMVAIEAQKRNLATPPKVNQKPAPVQAAPTKPLAKVKPKQTAKPTAVPLVKTGKILKKLPIKDGEVDYSAIPIGQEFEENGQRFVFEVNPLDDTKCYKKALVVPASNPHATPLPPSKEAYEAMMHAQAQAQAMMNNKINES